jgi:hypothetical protein
MCEELLSPTLQLYLYMKVNFANPTNGLVNFHHAHNVTKKGGNTKTFKASMHVNDITKQIHNSLP